LQTVTKTEFLSQEVWQTIHY